MLEVLDESGYVDEDTRFSMINLIPPSKDLVWSWEKGDEFPRGTLSATFGTGGLGNRRASAAARLNRSLREAS